MRKIRLLVVDEHQAVRTALEMRLKSSIDIEVLATVQDLREREFALEVDPPDVILFGLRSSRTRELGPIVSTVGHLAGRGIPVVVLASYADDIEREMLLRAGASRYLLKDINSSQLIDEIKATVAERPA